MGRQPSGLVLSEPSAGFLDFLKYFPVFLTEKNGSYTGSRNKVNENINLSSLSLSPVIAHQSEAQAIWDEAAIVCPVGIEYFCSNRKIKQLLQPRIPGSLSSWAVAIVNRWQFSTLSPKASEGKRWKKTRKSKDSGGGRKGPPINTKFPISLSFHNDLLLPIPLIETYYERLLLEHRCFKDQNIFWKL